MGLPSELRMHTRKDDFDDAETNLRDSASDLVDIILYHVLWISLLRLVRLKLLGMTHVGWSRYSFLTKDGDPWESSFYFEMILATPLRVMAEKVTLRIFGSLRRCCSGR